MNEEEKQAQRELDLGIRHPFDEGKIYYKDWAYEAACGIMCNLQDRRGIKNGFQQLDLDIRCEIIESMVAIIRKAKRGRTKSEKDNTFFPRWIENGKGLEGTQERKLPEDFLKNVRIDARAIKEVEPGKFKIGKFLIGTGKRLKHIRNLGKHTGE